MSRYCPATISVRMVLHSSRTTRSVAGAVLVAATMSSAHARARSPARIAAASAEARPVRRIHAVGVLRGDVGVQGESSATQPGAVHDVVVNQRAGLDQFERGADAQGGLRLRGPSTARAQGPPQEARTHELAAVQGETRDALGQILREHRVEGGGAFGALRQQALQHASHSPRDVTVDGVRFARAGRRMRGAFLLRSGAGATAPGARVGARMLPPRCRAGSGR